MMNGATIITDNYKSRQNREGSMDDGDGCEDSLTPSSATKKYIRMVRLVPVLVLVPLL